MVDKNGPQQSRTELKGGVLGFTFGLGGEPRMKLLVQHGNLLNGGFLSRNASHLKFQLPDILTRPGGDHGLGKFKILLAGKYVSEDVRSLKGGPLGGAVPCGGVKVDANDANIFAGESFTTEGAGRREARRGL